MDRYDNLDREALRQECIRHGRPVWNELHPIRIRERLREHDEELARAVQVYILQELERYLDEYAQDIGYLEAKVRLNLRKAPRSWEPYPMVTACACCGPIRPGWPCSCESSYMAAQRKLGLPIIGWSRT